MSNKNYDKKALLLTDLFLREGVENHDSSNNI
jgi:hypothetical protein